MKKLMTQDWGLLPWTLMILASGTLLGICVASSYYISVLNQMI